MKQSKELNGKRNTQGHESLKIALGNTENIKKKEQKIGAMDLLILFI